MKVRPWRDGDLERMRDAEPSFSPATLTSRFMIGTRNLPRAYLAALRRRPEGDRRRPIEVALADGELVAVGEGCCGLPEAKQLIVDQTTAAEGAPRSTWCRPPPPGPPSPGGSPCGATSSRPTA